MVKFSYDFSKVRLGMAAPLTDRYVSKRFHSSIMTLNKPREVWFLEPNKSGPLHFVRNWLVRKALEANVTHLWMYDTDQEYPQDTLIKLFERNLPVVAARVHRRFPPFDPIMLRRADNVNQYRYEMVPDVEWSQGGLIEVDATGCGAVLFDMQVFKKVPYPWFKWIDDDDPNVEPIGEDVFFWNKCRAAGIKIYVDADNMIPHITETVITEEAYWAFKKRTVNQISATGASLSELAIKKATGQNS
jgi:hypothetical protein